MTMEMHRTTATDAAASLPPTRLLPPACCALLLLLTGGVAALPSFAQKSKPAPPPKKAGGSGATGKPLKPGQAVPPPPGLVLYNQALAAAQRGDLDTALRLCREAVKAEPDAAALWATLAQFQLRKGQTDAALVSVTKATTLAPGVAPFWGERANIEARAGQWDAAIASGKKALAKEPKNDPALAALATAYLSTKRYQEAIPILTRLSSARGALDMAIGQNLVHSYIMVNDLKGALGISEKLAAKFPKDHRTHLSVADLKSRLGDMAGAYTALQTARRLAPKDYTVTLNTALAAEMLNKRDEALNLLDTLAKEHPKSGDPWFHRGRLMLSDTSRQDRYPQAERAFAEAVAREPEKALFRAYLGLAQASQGPTRADDARESFTRVLLQGDNRDETARRGLAYLAEQEKDWDRAAAYYGTMLQVNPANDEARRRRAGALLLIERKDEAYREFWELADRNPKDVKYLKELASLLIEDRRYPAARSAYTQVLQRAPGDGVALIGIARTYELQGDVVTAERQYRAALAADPKLTDAYRLLSESLARRNRTEERLKLLDQWLEADPRSNEARWERALIYREQKRDDEALAEMRKLTLRTGDPNRLNYRVGPARLYLDREMWDKAAAEYEKVLAEEPNEDSLRYPLAYAYEKMGRVDEAQKMLEGLATKAGGGPKALQPKTALAGLHERAKRLDDARRLYEEVLVVDPRHRDARSGLQRVGEAMGKPDLAFDLLNRIATASPQTPNLEAALSLEELLTQGAKTDYDRYVAFARSLAEKYPGSTEAKARAEKAVQQYGGAAASGGTAQNSGAPPEKQGASQTP